MNGKWKSRVHFPQEWLAEVCEREHVRKLSFFGSVLRDDFTAESDIDILIEYEDASTIGLFELIDLQILLSEKLGYTVDLRTPEDLSKYFRDRVLAEEEVRYVHG